MSGIFPIYCKKRIRDFTREKPRRKLPLNHRKIDRILYYEETFRRAWKYHLHVHSLHIPEPVLRKITYDAVYEALENKNGKIHYKDFITEYNKYKQIWDTEYRNLHHYLADWEAYKASDEFKAFKEEVKQIERFQKRARIHFGNALSFAYARFQLSYTEMGLEIEKKLLGWVEKAWSKSWLWFLTFFLVFEANSLYANTLGNNKYIERRYDWEQEEAIKIHIVPFWERQELSVPKEYQLLGKIYKEIILSAVGEVGSVLLTEVARRGTVQALIHIADILTTIARFHPALRTLSWGAELINALSLILDKSILAWIGWQIGLEWQVDGFIQAVCSKFLKYLYVAKTDAYLWQVENTPPGYIFEMAIKGLFLKYKHGYIDSFWEEKINWVKNYGTPKQRLAIDRIERALENKKRLEHFRKMYKAKLEEMKKTEIYIQNRIDTAVAEALQKKTEEAIEYLNTIVYNSYRDLQNEILDQYSLLAMGEGYSDIARDIITINVNNLERDGEGTIFLFDGKMAIRIEKNKMTVDYEIDPQRRRYKVTTLEFHPFSLETFRKGNFSLDRLKDYLYRLNLLMRDISNIVAKMQDDVVHIRLETLDFIRGFWFSEKLQARLRGRCMSVTRLGSIMRSKEIVEDVLKLENFEEKVKIEGYITVRSSILEYSKFETPCWYDVRKMYCNWVKFLHFFHAPSVFYTPWKKDPLYCEMFLTARKGTYTGYNVRIFPLFLERENVLFLYLWVYTDRFGNKFTYKYLAPPFCADIVENVEVEGEGRVYEIELWKTDTTKKTQYKKGRRSKVICLR